eukprot:scaffold245_cov256-Pinguiococcus_pyrenoidosus.AAC.22
MKQRQALQVTPLRRRQIFALAPFPFLVLSARSWKREALPATRPPSCVSKASYLDDGHVPARPSCFGRTAPFVAPCDVVHSEQSCHGFLCSRSSAERSASELGALLQSRSAWKSLQAAENLRFSAEHAVRLRVSQHWRPGGTGHPRRGLVLARPHGAVQAGEESGHDRWESK